MPADNRPYITVTLDMPDNPKYAHLSDALKFKLIRAWVWCAQHRSDGFIPMTNWRQMATKRQLAVIQMTDGVTVLEDGSGIKFDDYLEHQQGREASTSRRENSRSAGVKSGESRRKKAAQATAKAAQETLNKGDLIHRTDKEEEENNKRGKPLLSAHEAGDQLFETWWMCYPRKVGKPAARKAFNQAVKTIEFEQLHKLTAEFATDPNLPSGNETQFIPYPATWLNQHRWNDLPLTPRTGKIRKTATQRAEEYIQPLNGGNNTTAINGGYMNPFDNDQIKLSA